MTYMAPEIKEGKPYSGRQVDVFSLGVILFIIVQGIFPFKEARKEEYFYSLILTGRLDTYFSKVNGHNLSEEFKDLILRLFSYDGNLRPTTEQIREHAWMQNPTYSPDATREQLINTLQLKRENQQIANSQAAAMACSPNKAMGSPSPAKASRFSNAVTNSVQKTSAAAASSVIRGSRTNSRSRM